MSTELILDDIITDHRERMLNIRKYYPFFKLCEVSFDSFKEGKYASLDMGYITMAVLRYFLEENNFKDKDVTYPEYLEFMTKCLSRDFGLKLSKEENKEVADFIFDKLGNEGRPFVFEYFDPQDRKKRSLRLHLIESRIADNTVWYSISSDAIEFYLDTKEIKDESKISVEQLLLEKLINSKNFQGGTEVVKRINSEVERLKIRKNEVVAALAADVFSGISAYEQFVDTGMKWFEDEQRLFVKNSELISSSLKKAEQDYKNLSSEEFTRTISDIYELETELKTAMSKHSELLRACTDLQITADEIIRKAKLSKLRSSFDFKGTLENMIRLDDATVLENLVIPLFAPNLRKTLNVINIDQMLTYAPNREDKGEAVSNAPVTKITFPDEIEDERIRENYRIFMELLLLLLKKEPVFDLKRYLDVTKKTLGEDSYKNSDLYSFVVNLCQKTFYSFSDASGTEETFLDEILKSYIDSDEWKRFAGLSFYVELAAGKPEEIQLDDEFIMTNITFRREERQNG